MTGHHSAPPLDVGSTRTMRRSGRRESTTLLRVRSEADRRIRRELRTRGRVHRLDQLRTVDAEPWSVTATWLPVARFRGIEDAWRGEGSLSEVLLQRHGVRMRRGPRTFAAALADAQDSELLLLPVGAPVLLVRGINVDADGTPVAVVEHRFRGDRVEFEVEVA